MFGNEVFFDGKSMENVSKVEVLKVPEVILHILGCRAPSVRTALASSEFRFSSDVHPEGSAGVEITGGFAAGDHEDFNSKSPIRFTHMGPKGPYDTS